MNDNVSALTVLTQLSDCVNSFRQIAPFARFMTTYHEQLGRLETLDDKRHDIIHVTNDMPTVQLEVNEAKAKIEEVEEQNGLLNETLIKLQTEIFTRPTLAVVKQEIGRYPFGSRASSSAVLPGLISQDHKTCLSWKRQSLNFSVRSAHNLTLLVTGFQNQLHCYLYCISYPYEIIMCLLGSIKLKLK